MSSVLNGMPSCHLMPVFSTKSKVLPSGDTVQDLASQGTGSNFSLYLNRVSYIWLLVTKVCVTWLIIGLSIGGSESSATVNVPPLTVEPRATRTVHAPPAVPTVASSARREIKSMAWSPVCGEYQCCARR